MQKRCSCQKRERIFSPRGRKGRVLFSVKEERASRLGGGEMGRGGGKGMSLGWGRERRSKGKKRGKRQPCPFKPKKKKRKVPEERKGSKKEEKEDDKERKKRKEGMAAIFVGGRGKREGRQELVPLIYVKR